MSSLFCNLLFFLSEIKATLLIQKKITRRLEERFLVLALLVFILVHIELINGKRFRSEKAASKQSTRINSYRM